MNMKELRAKAPFILGTTYYAATPCTDLIVDQLRAAGMMPAVWAIEDLSRRVRDLEDQLDEYPEPEEVTELTSTLGRAVDVLEAVAGHIIDRLDDLVKLMDQHGSESEEDSALWLALSDLHEKLGSHRQTLIKATDELTEAKSVLED